MNAKRARNHLIFLASRGVGLAHVSKVSGVSRRTLFEIRSAKRQTVVKVAEAKILAVEPDEADP